jgi:ATP-binding protein involved in chromosome partitioning
VPATPDQVRAALAEVNFPGLDRDIVSFGFVESVEVDGGQVHIRLNVPSGDSRSVERMARDAHAAVSEIDGVDEVLLDVSAPQAASMQSAGPASGGMPVAGQQQPAGQPVGGGGQPEPLFDRDPIPGVKHVVAVASGKGGVGKSTVAVNLAIALNRRGHGVGIMDADIYGPSLPTMLGAHDEPDIADIGGGERKIIPLEKHGLKLMSLGFLQPEDAPVIWRGPLVMRAVRQFVRDVDWRGADILIIDLPPGTGDAQLTLTQSAPLDGAIIVTTPQDVALIDARKGLHMFEEVDVPVIGLIENMSVYTCPECGHQAHIFRSGGGQKTADELGVPLLGAVPIDPAVAESGDAGLPAVLAYPDSAVATAFEKIADAVEEVLAQE